MPFRSTKSTQPNKPAARQPYPFTAIVGQDEMKLALVLNAIDPRIGGVLVMGHRGTGKSTAVRALADLLPHISVVKNCIYRCDPADPSNLCLDCSHVSQQSNLPKTNAHVNVVELPLGATEDRVCGSIDIQRALNEGTKSFEPGLLARANRGFLYMDEVNLLDDHLVDLLLDVAVTGVNKVERENISIEHPASFVLIGSGNPEEGELRPQLLDRFGLHVEIATENDLEERVEIVERQQLFENDRDYFLSLFAAQQDELKKRIARARRILSAVRIERGLLKKIAEFASELKLDGHRGELTVTRAARALAALENRRTVNEADVKRVAPMSVRHRLRSDPFDETGSKERIRRAVQKVFDGVVNAKGHSSDGDSGGHGSSADREHISGEKLPESKQRKVGTNAGVTGSDGTGGEASKQTTTATNQNPAFVPEFREFQSKSNTRRSTTALSTRRSPTRDLQNRDRGRYSRATTAPTAKVAIDATMRALSTSGLRTSPSSKRPPAHLSKEALRYKQFSSKRGAHYILAIDTSGSMAHRRIDRAREVAVALLRKAYINRDHVSIVAFRGAEANVMLRPTRSMLRAKRTLESLPVGGSTPLTAGLLCALQLAKSAEGKHGVATVLLFTDGNANVSLTKVNGNRELRKNQIQKELRGLGAEYKKAGTMLFVVDTQNGYNESRNAHTVANILNAQFMESSSAASKNSSAASPHSLRNASGFPDESVHT